MFVCPTKRKFLDNLHTVLSCLIIIIFFFLKKGRSFITFCVFWSSFGTSAVNFVSDFVFHLHDIFCCGNQVSQALHADVLYSQRKNVGEL